jgi:hypothetical protein
MLSSKTHQSFPSDLYSTQYLVIFCRSRNRSASPVSADRKTGFNVGLTQQPRSGGTPITWNVRDVTDSSIRNEQMMDGSATIKHVSFNTAGVMT